MLCSVGFDGVVKLCLLDRFVQGDSGAENGGISTNNLEIHNPGQHIQGCSFSRFYPLLAIVCTNGFCTIYDLSPLQKSDPKNKCNAQKPDGDNPGQTAPVLQIGRFAVSEKGLFRVEFHPTIKNVMAVTCDSSEVKVFRFFFDP